MDIERLDIYNQFLLPAGVTPKRHKAIETTDIMLQMVASGSGVAVLPRWLVEEYAAKMDMVPVRLGARGIAKQIFLGARETETCRQLFIEAERFLLLGDRCALGLAVSVAQDAIELLVRSAEELIGGHLLKLDSLFLKC